jgi:hypothetical protein
VAKRSAKTTRHDSAGVIRAKRPAETLQPVTLVSFGSRFEPLAETIPPYSVCSSVVPWIREENLRQICKDEQLENPKERSQSGFRAGSGAAWRRWRSPARLAK